MGLMMRRQALLAQMMQSGLGEYTKGYYAVLTPSSATKFVIPHNLGIIPKVCIVEANFEPTEGVDVGLDAVYAFNVYGMTVNGGVNIVKYFYRNETRTYDNPIPNLDHVSESDIKLKPMYSDVRSPWNTNGTYAVTVLG